MTAENVIERQGQTLDGESVNQLKDQLKATWEKLPDEDKATVALELIETLVEGERLLFREALDIRWPITSESLPATFALLTITPDDLAQIGLVEEDIELFDDDKLQEMSTDIRDHYVVQGFWEELKYHTNHFLGGLQKHNRK